MWAESQQVTAGTHIPLGSLMTSLAFLAFLPRLLGLVHPLLAAGGITRPCCLWFIICFTQGFSCLNNLSGEDWREL